MQRATDLLDQQLWCWGRDVESPSGNLLVQHGFRRTPKPEGSPGSSLYRMDLPASGRVVLRGFGVFFGDDRWGGLFLRRFGFSPQLTPEADLCQPLWSAEDLPTLGAPRPDQVSSCRSLLLTLIDWIGRYEAWIAAHVGVAYRRESLIDWLAKHETAVRAEEMAAAWQILEGTVADHTDDFISPERPEPVAGSSVSRPRGGAR